MDRPANARRVPYICPACHLGRPVVHCACAECVAKTRGHLCEHAPAACRWWRCPHCAAYGDGRRISYQFGKATA